MPNKITFITKSEWFGFKSPLAEPEDSYWVTGAPYELERRETSNAVYWYGINKNWRGIDGKWSFFNKDWIPCKPPIYETMYQEWLSKKNIPSLYETASEEAKKHDLGEE